MAFACLIAEGELLVKKLCIIGLFILIAGGCRAQPHPTCTPSPLPTAPSSPLIAPVAEPSSPPPGPTPISTPVPTRGAITGQLIGRESGRPAGGAIVYLGNISYLQPDSIPVITMRQRASPHTMADESGYFALLDLEPGTYALILWTPMNSSVIDDPETGETLLVTVEAGVITELGKITVILP